jgi:8-oxo-dGTP diphosphatase
MLTGVNMSKPFTQYVLGFAFTYDGQVALIEKNRPAWQAGKWNGIGGHMEPGEDIYEAMAREFQEETGVETPWGWRRVGRMVGEDDKESWAVHVLTITDECVAHVTSMTDEQVELVYLYNVGHRPIQDNLQALILMCQIQPSGPSNTYPKFTLDYRD